MISFFKRSLIVNRNASYIYFGLLDRFKKVDKMKVFCVNNLEGEMN
jgi:hypothetical protein